MTKKDFEALAGAIKAAQNSLIAQASPESRPLILSTMQQMAIGIADVCAGQNARFNRGRFLAACGMGPV